MKALLSEREMVNLFINFNMKVSYPSLMQLYITKDRYRIQGKSYQIFKCKW